MYVSQYHAMKLYNKERERETEAYRAHRELVLQATRRESSERHEDNPMRRVMRWMRVEMQKHRGAGNVRPAPAI
jgi:hypothetical protein